jgi:hypothetical protein
MGPRNTAPLLLACLISRDTEREGRDRRPVSVFKVPIWLLKRSDSPAVS